MPAEIKPSATKPIKLAKKRKLDKCSLKNSVKYQPIPLKICVQKPSVPDHLLQYLSEIAIAIWNGVCVSDTFLRKLTPMLYLADYLMLMQWEKNNLGHLKFWFLQTLHQANISLNDCIRLYQRIDETRKQRPGLKDRIFATCTAHVKHTAWYVACTNGADESSSLLPTDRLSLEKCLFAAEQSIPISYYGTNSVGRQSVESIVSEVERFQIRRLYAQPTVSPTDLWFADLDWSTNSYLFDVIRQTFKNGFIWSTNTTLVQSYLANIFGTTSIITQVVGVITEYLLVDTSKISAK